MKSREYPRKGEANFVTTTALILGLMMGILLGSAARVLYNGISGLSFLLPNEELLETNEID